MTARISQRRLRDAFDAGADMRAADARELAKRFTTPAAESRIRTTMDAIERSFLANTRIHDQRDAATYQAHLQAAMDHTRFFGDVA